MTDKINNAVMLPEDDDTVTQVATVRDRLLEAESTANLHCIAQEPMVHALLLSILSREHIILVGPHGCNKTRAINILLRQMGADGNGDSFYATLDKFTPPEVLLGMFSPKALKEDDRWVRNTTHKLPEAKFAFIGEVFRGNSAVRASLHTIMNERYIENDGQRVECPLHSMVCDSNSYPYREEDFPFYDRILYRYHVTYIDSADDRSFISMLKSNGVDSVSPLLSVAEVEGACDEVTKVTIPKMVYRTLYKIRSALLSKEVTLSDRRWHKSLIALQAQAWLSGKNKVTLADIHALTYTLWADPDQYKIASDIVMSFYKEDVSTEAANSDGDIVEQAKLITEHANKENTMEAIGAAIVSLSNMVADCEGDDRIQVAAYLDELEAVLMKGSI